MARHLPLSLGAALVISSLCGCGPGAVRIPPSASPTLAAAAAASATLQASFKARMELGNDLRRFEGTLAAVAPDRLYVEIAGPVGGVRAVLAAAGGRVVVLLPGTREYLEEAAAPATFESLLGLRLETSALIDLILSGRTAGAPDCAQSACERRLALAPDREGVSRDLVVRREGARLSARLETDDGDPSGFHGLEWRLANESPIEASRLADDFFSPAIPAGWSRLRPGPSPGSLLQPR